MSNETKYSIGDQLSVTDLNGKIYRIKIQSIATYDMRSVSNICATICPIRPNPQITTVGVSSDILSDKFLLSELLNKLPNFNTLSYIKSNIGVNIMETMIIAVNISWCSGGIAEILLFFIVCKINKPNSPPCAKISDIKKDSREGTRRTRATIYNAKNLINTNPTTPTSTNTQ